MKPLLKVDQIIETENELRRLEGTITQPHAQDKPLMAKQIRNMKERLEKYSPKVYEGRELDEAVKRAEQLKTEMVEDGMPTAAEMRKKPPGAVNKHLRWESRNKGRLLEWKNIQRRLNAGNEDRDVANFELFRPVGGSGELSMDGAAIPGKQIHLPARLPTPGAVASDSELEVLAEAAPELRKKFATLDGETRAQVLQTVRDLIAAKTDPKLAVVAKGRK